MLQHPFFSVFIRPAQTLAKLHKNDHNTLTLLFLIANGLMIAFYTTEFFIFKSTHIEASLLHKSLTIITLILLAIPLGVVNIQLQTWLLQLTGSWLGGKANSDEIEHTYLWSLAPILIFTILYLVSTLLTTKMSSTFTLSSPTPMSAVWIIAMLWTVFILTKGLATSQKFSLSKALTSVILASAIPFLLMIAIGLGTTIF